MGLGGSAQESLGPWGGVLDQRLQRQQEAGGLKPALPISLAALNKGSFHPQPGLSGPAQEVVLASPFLTRQLTVLWWESSPRPSCGTRQSAALPTAKPQPRFPFLKSRRKETRVPSFCLALRPSTLAHHEPTQDSGPPGLASCPSSSSGQTFIECLLYTKSVLEVSLNYIFTF